MAPRNDQLEIGRVSLTFEAGLHVARTGNVAMFEGEESTVDERQERTLGSFHNSLAVAAW